MKKWPYNTSAHGKINSLLSIKISGPLKSHVKYEFPPCRKRNQDSNTFYMPRLKEELHLDILQKIHSFTSIALFRMFLAPFRCGVLTNLDLE